MGKTKTKSKKPINNDEIFMECCPGVSFYQKYARPVTAEFFATLIFVFIGTASAATGNLLVIATAHGLAIAFLVTATATVSGGHINPAVTLAAMFANAISIPVGVLYIISQFTGGIVGAVITRGVIDITVYNSVKGGNPVLGAETDQIEGMVVELILTFILVLTVLMTAISEESSLAPMAIGLAVLVDIIAGGNLTGSSVNPARALGPAVAYSFTSGELWSDFWLYIVGPILGALLAAFLYRFSLVPASKRVILSDRFLGYDEDEDEEE